MESLGFWGKGPIQPKEELTHPVIMQLVGSLQSVVEMCCKVARMEGLEMKNILNRTYET